MVDLVYYTKIDGDVSRPPLFMIHTVPLDSTYLLDSLKGIETDQTLVLLDLPSHGKSEDVPHADITFDYFVKDIDELRKELGYDKISIYGHGVGGFIAMK
ncbi:MAG: alpha/beta hydrolase, partial [Candidatus Heimdallarchaeota archaeon]|nr:alpha/beta hydrolase [Candidatus Heimdallarchaeota archaeon]